MSKITVLTNRNKLGIGTKVYYMHNGYGVVTDITQEGIILHDKEHGWNVVIDTRENLSPFKDGFKLDAAFIQRMLPE